MTESRDQATTDEAFRSIVNNTRTQERTMSNNSKTPMNFGLATGTLLIILAAVFAMIWGFGADRFGTLAAGAGGAGLVLTITGAIINRGKIDT